MRAEPRGGSKKGGRGGHGPPDWYDVIQRGYLGGGEERRVFKGVTQPAR